MPKIAALQLRSDGDLQANLLRAGELIQEAAVAGAQLVVLPEHFAYYNWKDLPRAAMQERTPTGPAREFLADQARLHALWLVGGTLPLFKNSGDTKPCAASLLINPVGREVARYDKMHLFDASVSNPDVTGVTRRYCESDRYQRGDAITVVSTPLGALGLSVCYDLRFPEMYRVMANQGVELIVAPSAFTAATGKAHWELLLRARAIDNLCYVVGANICHRDHPAKPTWGGSMIVSPWGDILARMDGEEGFVIADVDIGTLATVRSNLPILEHRRF